MGTGYSKKKKQAKKLQEQFTQMQEQMKNSKLVGVSGNGLVTLTLNGEGEMTDISIKADCVDPEDIEGLEDLIKAAHADAAKQLKEQQMPGNLGEMDLGSLGF